MPTAILDTDLCGPLADMPVAAHYTRAEVLVRWQGKPLGRVRVRACAGRVGAAEIWDAAHGCVGDRLRRAVLAYLAGERNQEHVERPAIIPCSVIVCTRNRAADLTRCLESLAACRPGPGEIIVVDNAPTDDSTREAAARFPVRYIVEPRKGLNWARACGAREAGQELLLYTDDDVQVDRGWVGAMCEPFADFSVGAVTGLIMPLEMETEAQELFEHWGGFVSSPGRRVFTSLTLPPAAAGQAGAGASMAFRRSAALSLALFESEIDCGTAALSGGDHYAFSQILRSGNAIVYTPDAVCWHRHRRSAEELRHTLYGYSVGVYSFLLRCLLVHGELSAIRVGLSWLWHHHIPELWRGLTGNRGALPKEFILEEWRGVFAAPRAYFRTRRLEQKAGLSPARLHASPAQGDSV